METNENHALTKAEGCYHCKPLVQQRNELAAVLAEVNEFCQKRGIGKVGDSASVALMQRYDELAAQVERLRNAAIESQDWNWISAKEEADELGNDFFEIAEMRALWDLVHSETPPSALAALKAQWQAEIHRQYAEIAACDKPAKEPWNSGCGMAPDGGYECNCGQCE